MFDQLTSTEWFSGHWIVTVSYHAVITVHRKEHLNEVGFMLKSDIKWLVYGFEYDARIVAM